jgi:hypothetical protein
MIGLTFFPTVNCGHKKPKAVLKGYIAISDSVKTNSVVRIFIMLMNRNKMTVLSPVIL